MYFIMTVGLEWLLLREGGCRAIIAPLAPSFSESFKVEQEQNNGGGHDVEKHEENGYLMPLLKQEPHRVVSRNFLDHCSHGLAEA